MAGGLPYRPVHHDTSPAGTIARRYLRGLVTDALRSTDPLDTSSHTSLGAACALLADWDCAISSLQRVRDDQTASSASLIDLSAAYLGRAARDDVMADAVSALAMAERAIRRGDAQPEAWFNRALAMEALGLPETVDAWDDYLAHDSSGPFSDEARARRTAATRGAVPSDAKVHGVEFGDLLPYFTWATAADESTSHAAMQAATVRAASAAAAGDRFHADVTAALAGQPDADLGTWKRALADLSVGLEAFTDDEFTRGARQLEDTRRMLSSDHPLLPLIDFRLGLASYYATAYSDTHRQLEPALRIARRRGYLALEARIGRVLGVTCAMEGRFDEALAYYRRTQDIYDQLGAHAQASLFAMHQAEIADYLGDVRGAWQARARALRVWHRLPRATDRLVVLTSTSIAALDQGLPEVSAILQRDAAEVVAAEKLGAADRTEQAILDARIALSLGQGDRARRALASASREAAAISDEAMRARNEAEVALVWVAAGEGTASELQPALAYFADGDGLARLADAQAARAAAWRRHGDRGAARADLLDATDAFSKRASFLEDEERRLTHDAAGRPLFERLVDLEMDEPVQLWRALLALNLLKRRFTSQTMALDVASFEAGVRRNVRESGTPLLAFASLPDRLVVWFLDQRGTLEVSERAFTRQQLGLLVDAFADAIVHGDAEASSRIGAILAEALLPAALSGSLPARLRIVPDGPLARLPFAFLPTSSTSRLIDATVLEWSPSVLGGPSQHDSRGRTGGVLVVGDAPTAMAALPGARAEAWAIGDVYPESRVLLGAAATRDALLEGMRTAEVLHFAGHAVVNRERPLLSRLVLAARGDDQESNVLAADVMRLDLRAMRLAVLAAGDGVMSLATALTNAGVRQVVASLYPIEDEAARTLFVAFHEAFARSGDAAASLAAVQREMGVTRPSTPPRDWAGLICIVAPEQMRD